MFQRGSMGTPSRDRSACVVTPERRSPAQRRSCRRRHPRVATAVALGALVVVAVPIAITSGQQAAGAATTCSTTTGNTSCTVATSLTITTGTLALESSPSLYWDVVLGGYDQWASASATTLTSCTNGSGATTCSGGTAPKLLAIDGTGSGQGWGISEYLSTSDLPSGTKLVFNGTGSATIGDSQVSPVSTDPFAATAPTNVCDYGSSCAPATVATSCTARLGYTSCPTYPVDMTAGTNATAQVDLYSASSSSGMGAVCFGSGTATAIGCTGITPSDFYNLGVPSNASQGTFTTTVVNLTITSGP